MTEEREGSWEAEDRSEEATGPGTRDDIGLGSPERDDAPPDPEAEGGRGAAGSRSDAATGTEVEGDR